MKHFINFLGFNKAMEITAVYRSIYGSRPTSIKPFFFQMGNPDVIYPDIRNFTGNYLYYGDFILPATSVSKNTIYIITDFGDGSNVLYDMWEQPLNQPLSQIKEVYFTGVMVNSVLENIVTFRGFIINN